MRTLAGAKSVVHEQPGRRLSKGVVLRDDILAASLCCSSMLCFGWTFLTGNSQIFVVPLAFYVTLRLTLLSRLLSARPWKWPLRIGICCVSLLLLAAAAVAWQDRLSVRHPAASDLTMFAQELDHVEQSLRDGEAELALDRLDSLPRRSQNDRLMARGHYDRGLALVLLQRETEARESLLNAVELDPMHADAAYELARIARHQGRITEAYRWVKQCLDIDPAYAAARELRSELSRFGDGVLGDGHEPVPSTD